MFHDSPAFSGYSVTNLEQAKLFYIDTLGCRLDRENMGLHIVFPNGHSVFLYEKADHVPATFTVLNFPVASINDTLDALLEAGVAMERYDSMPGEQGERGIMRGKAAGMGPDIAWFKDPFGNVLAVLEV